MRGMRRSNKWTVRCRGLYLCDHVFSHRTSVLYQPFVLTFAPLVAGNVIARPFGENKRSNCVCR